ncbi:hypothetical protein WI37_08035 [Burkholderia ubonensis]|nr:hypothetical protein WI37_08035 [Burkholderia ubonensis]
MGPYSTPLAISIKNDLIVATSSSTAAEHAVDTVGTCEPNDVKLFLVFQAVAANRSGLSRQ